MLKQTTLRQIVSFLTCNYRIFLGILSVQRSDQDRYTVHVCVIVRASLFAGLIEWVAVQAVGY